MKVQMIRGIINTDQQIDLIGPDIVMYNANGRAQAAGRIENIARGANPLGFIPWLL
jgi:hypothetical protein